LGRGTGTQDFIRRILEEADLPPVIDADGLNAVDAAFITEHSNGRWILTPHMGEFKRLAGTEEMNADDRVRLAQHFAREWGCVLLLKGLPSVAASPDGRAWICATGNPALATAGTGDVLAGMCAGLLAQGLSPIEAAVAAMHIGGAAADRFAERRAARSMQAMDLVGELPSLLKDRFEEA
ncbi:MAG: NAD(P)H-hydrate dehydratase, partial [Rhodothermales bacterium]